MVVSTLSAFAVCLSNTARSYNSSRTDLSHTGVSQWERSMWRTAEPVEMFACLSLFMKMMFLPKLTKAGISIPAARQECRHWKYPGLCCNTNFLATTVSLRSGKDHGYTKKYV